MPEQYSRLHKGEAILRLGCNLANGKVGGNSKIGCVLAIDFSKKDGDSFISDDCFGHLCTNYGSKWQLDGRYFDGVDNYVDVGVLPKYSPSTIEAWVNSPKAQKDYAGIVFGGTGLTGWGLGIQNGATYSRISTGDAQDNWSIEFYNEANYPAGRHQMVLTNDGAIQGYRRDGKFVSQHINTLTNSGTAQGMSIGKWGTDLEAHSYFQGLVGKAHICNFADYIPRILSRSIGG